MVNFYKTTTHVSLQYRHRETSYDARSKKLLEVSKTGEMAIEALSRQRDALELRFFFTTVLQQTVLYLIWVHCIIFITFIAFFLHLQSERATRASRDGWTSGWASRGRATGASWLPSGEGSRTGARCLMFYYILQISIHFEHRKRCL